MSLPLSFIICEATSTWASALRVAIAPKEQQQPPCAARIFETRTLPELIAALSENAPQLALVETRPDNLAPILQMFAERRQPLLFVALLSESLRPAQRATLAKSSNREIVADALAEAGALAVVQSPRHIAAVLPLAEKLRAAHTERSKNFGDNLSISELAWAALPWQDA